MGHLLGIDLGTSSVRAIIISIEGDILGSSQQEYPILTPQVGWAEQDPETWWSATCKVIKRVTNNAGIDPKEIKAIGLSGQMHGLVLVDASGKPLRPAIIWPDQRSQEQCKEIAQKINKDNLYKITGIPIATGLFGVSLLWVKKYEPEIYEKIFKAILPKDYIRYRLTGELATDVTDGSGTLLFDIKKRTWSLKIIHALDICSDILPTPFESEEVAGKVSRKASQETGLYPGIPVAAGGADQVMGAIGNGTVEEGIVAATIGTGGQLITSVKEAITDPKQRLHTFCHALKDSWLIMGAILAAGLSLRWFKENFGEIEELTAKLCNIQAYDLLSKEAAKVMPGSEGLLYLPYLSGERTPHMDPKARGCFIGLTMYHTRAHMIRAIMEGVAYAIKDSFCIFQQLNIPIQTVICSGGGAKGSVWRQIQADVYGMPLYIVNREEHSSYGAALLAGVTSGEYSNIREVCKKNIITVDTVYPIKQNVDIYSKYYSIYSPLYSSLKPTFELLNGLVQ